MPIIGTYIMHSCKIAGSKVQLAKTSGALKDIFLGPSVEPKCTQSLTVRDPDVKGWLSIVCQSINHYSNAGLLHPLNFLSSMRIFTSSDFSVEVKTMHFIMTR